MNPNNITRISTSHVCQYYVKNSLQSEKFTCGSNGRMAAIYTDELRAVAKISVRWLIIIGAN